MRLILLFIATTAFAGTPKVATDAAVVVFVEGHGTLPGGLLYGAKALVSSLFDNVNVHISWQEGKPPTGVSPERVVILVHFAATAAGGVREQPPTCSSPTAFACSFPFHSGNPLIVVMYERVRFFSRRPRLFQRLIAYAMAHEITHALTAREAHSETGIMKQYWTAADYDRMENSALEFTPRDVQFIQDGVDYRHRRR